jgi:hypothetical protein
VLEEGMYLQILLWETLLFYPTLPVLTIPPVGSERFIPTPPVIKIQPVGWRPFTITPPVVPIQQVGS